MQPPRSVAGRTLLGLALASLALTGCQSVPPAASPVPPAAAGPTVSPVTTAPRTTGIRARAALFAAERAQRIANAVPRGTGRVEASSEALTGARRRVQMAGFETPGITRVRLVVMGPDMVTRTSAPVAWTPAAGGAITPPERLAIEVPAGINRVFVLEALDADGAVIASMRSLGTVTADQATPVTFNVLTDAAGRSLQACLEYLRPRDPFAATLVERDYTSAIASYVAHVVGYDAAAHTYSRLDPYYFNDVQFAVMLEEEQSAFRIFQPRVMPLPEVLTTPAAGDVAVELMTEDGTPPEGEVLVTLYDPISAHAPLTLADAEVGTDRATFRFEGVPSGFFDVAITVNGQTVVRQAIVEAGLEDQVLVVLPATEELN